MTQNRRYRLLCPIARGLDHLGDRWTLLILRDLHAGPVRFSNLQSGLPGLASNLLTERLRRLEADGFVLRRNTDHGVTVYELTDFGETTGKLLFELATIGSQFPPDEDVLRPNNLRTIAVSLKEALRRVARPSTSVNAGLIVDGEPFSVSIADGKVAVRYQTPEETEVTFATSYEPLIDLADGNISMEEFADHHVKILSGDPDKLTDLSDLLAEALAADRWLTG